MRRYLWISRHCFANILSPLSTRYSPLQKIMENDLFNKRRDKFQDPTATQEGFNNFVKKYNHEFLFFLQRAASGYYDSLVASARLLKDFHEMVVFIQSATPLQFEVVPLPFTFRHGSEYYRLLGFNDEEIAKIHSFFAYCKETFNKDFEECMSEDKKLFAPKTHKRGSAPTKFYKGLYS